MLFKTTSGKHFNIYLILNISWIRKIKVKTGYGYIDNVFGTSDSIYIPEKSYIFGTCFLVMLHMCTLLKYEEPINLVVTPL